MFAFLLGSILLSVVAFSQKSLASVAFCENADYESGALGISPYQTYQAAPFHPIQLNYALPPTNCPANNDVQGYFFLTPAGVVIMQDHVLILNPNGTLVGAIPGTFMGLHKYNGVDHVAVWKGQYEPGRRAYGRGYIVLLDNTYSPVANLYDLLYMNGVDIDQLQDDSKPWGWRRSSRVQVLHHELEITSNKTAIMVAYPPQAANLSAYGGPENGYIADGVVQEVDITTGRALFTWRASEHVDPGECYAAMGDATGKGTREYPWDYFHINSIQKQDDGNYLVSSRHCHVLYLIHPSGDIIWRMGGKMSDFVLPKGIEFSWQHHARIYNRSILSLFNNGATHFVKDLPFPQAFLLKFDYSNVDREISIINIQSPFNRKPAAARGSIQLLENGESIVGWGTSPYFSQHDANGEIKWSAQFAPSQNDNGAYRVFLHDWVGRPSTLPSMQISNTSTSNNVTVYAWWNGATEVSAWQLFGSAISNPLALTFLDVVSKVDFESTLRYAGEEDYEMFRVAAIDANGEILAYSDLVSLDGEIDVKADSQTVMGTRY
ncbi:hypothetical protein GYMLUDRAFT_84423 [Collybiopsis luxurians FD-317 M1]|uniref:ASST-domain-containing protein n=1 Tax=Collybiopsis luxurians FD-317 M1 TaxID=944289 RepID=A0A0D0D0K4_9AGAR|nr:hypothetical protein GYMLUDRAFT_84423 [Collybiopsis luxurians FD-317 M1]